MLISKFLKKSLKVTKNVQRNLNIELINPKSSDWLQSTPSDK